jgi:hypothetical protein
MQLSERGQVELRPGVAPVGLCRTVVIDPENQTRPVVQDQRCHGTMANPQPLLDGRLEVTWAEGGAVRIIPSGGHQRWTWSQPRTTWEEGRFLPTRSSAPSSRRWGNGVGRLRLA